MIPAEVNARLWVMNLADGDHSLLDMAERSGIPFSEIHKAAEALSRAGLLSSICSENFDKEGRGFNPAA
jgi:aminopeptidase-like protein